MSIVRGSATPPALREPSITAISTTITANAVDVFVYDTRKDSDGGAWRKRVQNTSWYNETLGTATRGVRQDFPAVAVIVAAVDSVTIYDGDDPDMPMWMVFNTTSGSMLRSAFITSVAMMNGELWVGHSSGSAVHWINFIKDSARWITASTSYGGYFQGGTIVNRNWSGNNYYNNVGGASDVVINSSAIVDVAVTVVPNSPLDSLTKLPVLTVALAHDAGASIIKNDGTVVNSTYQNFGSCSSIEFVKGGSDTSGSAVKVMMVTDSGSTNGRFVHVQNLSNIGSNVAGYRGDYAADVESYAADVAGTISGGYGFHKNICVAGNNNWITCTTPNKDFGSGEGLAKIYSNGSSPKAALSAAITTTSNTGWMLGDIRGAYLCSATAETLTGSGELVTNGSFTSDASGWTAYNGTIAYSAGTMQITRTSGTGFVAYQPITCVVGKTYYVSAKINSSGSRGDLIVTNAIGSGAVMTRAGTNGSTKVVGGSFVATNTTMYIHFGVDSTSTSIYVDDVTCRLADRDESYNFNGNQIIGSLTKTPVATGSTVMAYTGFSASNYLTQQQNSTLDMGTGEICISAWVKFGATSGTVRSVYYRYNAAGNVGYNLAIHTDGSVYFYNANGGTADYTPYSGKTSMYGTDWKHVVAVRKANWIAVYINGVLYGSASAGPLNLTSTDATAYIGTNADHQHGSPDGIALLRISATAPDDVQIMKMYNDEKALFQPNAKTTIYGSSNAVNAVAYDDATGLVHVGTSSGRSVFNGLRRVDNTTTPVTTAISASNGLVAEQ